MRYAAAGTYRDTAARMDSDRRGRDTVARRAWHRLLVMVLGAGLAAAGTAGWLLWLGPRFDAAGISINPRARVDPARRYEVVVWEEEIAAPWARESQQEVLAGAIEAFRQRWPNVDIVVHVIDAGEGRARLTEAVAAGRPPDIYGTVRGMVYHPSHQIPAGPYLPAAAEGEPPVFHPAAERRFTREGVVWGWPRALWWETWLADGTALDRVGVPVDRVLAAGWAWDEVEAFVERAKSWMETPLLLEPGVAALEHLLLNAAGEGLRHGTNAKTPTTQEAPYVSPWDETSVRRVAAFLKNLQQAGTFRGDAAGASRTRLEGLFTGRAAVIGPVGPQLALVALRRDPERFTLFPVPHHPDAAPVAPMEPGGYFVFRQEPYQGDDHTRLAMELAGWLAARTESWLSEALGLVPARTGSFHAWQSAAPLNAASQALLAAYLTLAPAGGLLPPEERDALAGHLAPHWQVLWSSSSLPETWAEEVWRVLEGSP